MKLKQTLAAVLAATMTLSMAGCGGGGNSSSNSDAKPGATEIVFWHAMGGVMGEQVDLMIKNFNESQDKIHVTAQYQGKYDDELTKLKSAMTDGSGSGPDIVQVYDIGSKFMVDSGYVVPVEDFIAADESFHKEDIEPNLVNYYSVDGKQYAMPFNSSTPLLYYNKVAFKEAGLDPEKAPETFAQVLEYAEKLTKKDGDKVTQYGFSMAIYGWFFEQLIAVQGEFYADNNNGRTANATKVAFDENGAGLNVVQTWKNLVDSGFVGNFGRNTDDTRNAFIAGRTAMYLDSTAQLASVIKGVGGRFEIGTGNMPKIGEKEDGGVIIGGGSLWIVDNKDETRKNAAWEFVKYASSPEAQAAWMQGTGYFATNIKSYEIESMKAYLEENPNFTTAIDQLHNTPTNEFTGGALLGVFPEARSKFEENMELVLMGQQTPEDCIKNVASAVNAAITNYNETTETAK